LWGTRPVEPVRARQGNRRQLVLDPSLLAISVPLLCNMTGPLDSWRVVDCTDLRGALCGRILADLGADVVKLLGPGLIDASDTTSYRYRNANKRGVTVDPSGVAGKQRLCDLLAKADVFVENLDKDGRSRFGVEPHEVLARHPHLVHVAISDFGLSGRRSHWRLEPLTAQAAGGSLFASGFPDEPPCWLPGYLGFDAASIYGAVGAIAAVMDRRRHGRGQLVEISVQEATLAGTNPWSIAMNDYLKINPLLPARGSRNADGSYLVLPASDGWVRVLSGNARQWRGFLRLMRDPAALAGPEWEETLFRLMNGDVVRLVAADSLVDRTRTELFAEALDVGAALGIVQMPSEFVDHAQSRSRQIFAATDFPGLEDAPFPRPPLRFSETPGGVRRPAPEEGDLEVVGFNVSSRATSRALEVDSESALLEGVLVVEFGMAAVGPEVSLVLSELGADVVKVESNIHLDVLRTSGMDRINCGFAFNTECRGRRSVVVNLTTEQGRQIAFDLCARADVVVENFRGGVLDRMGLGYEAVRQRNPRVIYASSQGYGRSGPLAETPAYGPLILGFVGQHHLWNHPNAPYPCGTSLNHPDHVASKLLAAGVLAALDHRHTTGQGQHIEMAQIEFAAFLNGEIYLDAYLNGVDPVAVGNASSSACPHGVYAAAGDDEWLAVAVSDDRAWGGLCVAAGWLERREFRTLQGRLDHRIRIDELLAGWVRGMSAPVAAEILQAHGVSASPVMGPLDHLDDAHLADRDFIVTLDHPEVGSERHAGNPIRMALTQQRVASSAPCLGVDTQEVLSSLLGIDGSEVAQLMTDGICI
jgi:crotonobetainyl-CoA:carnitine CoA-transferase CaiB-like acyl-CoA transferase